MNTNLVNKNIDTNLKIIKTKLNADLSYDLVIREFKFLFNKKEVRAFLVFFDGMINKDFVNENILKKANSTFSSKHFNENEDIEDFFENHVISNYSLEKSDSFKQIVDKVCKSHCAIFIDGYNKCFLCDMIKYEHRSISTPTFESSIKGTQEAFNEVLNINTALIRKYVNDSNLIIEKVDIGKRAKNTCAVMYIKGLTNPKLVKRVKSRISNIDTDIILTTDNLSPFIETNTFSVMPQIMPTEKPDRVASFLMQGRCVILTNNSPIAGVIPTTIVDWFHSSEDGYIRAPFNFFLKLIRIAAIFVSLLLPALYIATVTYHIDILPTNIAMLLAASLTMIIVGFTGICMYALPNYYSTYGLRNFRYILIILAFINGYLALSFGVLIFLLVLADTFSIGTRLLPSFYIDKKRNIIEQVFTEPAWKREFRPYYVKPIDKFAQGKISRRWLFNEKKQ